MKMRVIFPVAYHDLSEEEVYKYKKVPARGLSLMVVGQHTQGDFCIDISVESNSIYCSQCFIPKCVYVC